VSVTAAAPKLLAEPLAGGIPGAVVQLHPLVCGTLAAPRPFLVGEPGVRGRLRALGLLGAPRVTIPVMAWALRHPGAGWLLVDTGLHPSVAWAPRQNLGRVGAAILRGVRLEKGWSAPERLRALGVEPDAVRAVVMTHLHLDHASALSEFDRATVVLDRREWQAAYEGKALRGYVRRQFDLAFDFRVVDFATQGRSHATFARTFDLFADGSVVLISTPGHSAGHIAVLLRTTGGSKLLAGDAIYLRETLANGTLPAFCADEHLARRSLHELQVFARQYPDVEILPSHEPELLARYGAGAA